LNQQWRWQGNKSCGSLQNLEQKDASYKATALSNIFQLSQGIKRLAATGLQWIGNSNCSQQYKSL
jgi:hypothetical protein